MPNRSDKRGILYSFLWDKELVLAKRQKAGSLCEGFVWRGARRYGRKRVSMGLCPTQRASIPGRRSNPGMPFVTVSFKRAYSGDRPAITPSIKWLYTDLWGAPSGGVRGLGQSDRVPVPGGKARFQPIHGGDTPMRVNLSVTVYKSGQSNAQNCSLLLSAGVPPASWRHSIAKNESASWFQCGYAQSRDYKSLMSDVSDP